MDNHEKPNLGHGLSDPKNLAGLIVIALVLAFGLWKLNAPRAVAPESQINEIQTQSEVEPETLGQVQKEGISGVEYMGIEGQTALDILKNTHEVQTQDYGDLGEFVHGIDGKLDDATHFWSFYVNGQPATVGAAKYVTKADDKIEWKYEEIK